jgi:U3 small nucleolar RNA-associated protein 18
LPTAAFAMAERTREKHEGGTPQLGAKRGRRQRGWEVTPQELAETAAVFGAAVATSMAQRARVERAEEAGGGAAARWDATKAATTASAWHDDDDGHGDSGADGRGASVRLAAQSRLRKLRESREEDAVTTGELERRLRKAHGRLAGGSAAAGGAGVRHWTVSDTDRLKAEGVGAGSDEEDAAAELEAVRAAEAVLLRGSARYTKAHVKARVGAPSGHAGAAGGGREDDGDEDGGGGGAGGDGTGSGPLPAGTVAISRNRDLNRTDPAKAVVQSVRFHPSGAVALTGSLDHMLRFFRVDGKENNKIASVHFAELPIATADWSWDGREVFATGRRPFWYTYDVEAGTASRIARPAGSEDRSLESAVVQRCGRDAVLGPQGPLIAFLCDAGRVHVVSQRTKAWVSTLKMEGAVRGAAFLPDPATGFVDIVTTGSHGQVYVWDARTQRCRWRHADEGSTGSTVLATCAATGLYAVGSNLGIVNAYTAATWGDTTGGRGGEAHGSAGGDAAVASLFPSAAAAVKPTHTWGNLTTAVSQLTFSSGGAILAAASQRKQDSMKLFHVPSGTAFANWPTAKTPLSYVTAIDFSPSDGYLAVGNDKGRVLLYRLHHYSEA